MGSVKAILKEKKTKNIKVSAGFLVASYVLPAIGLYLFLFGIIYFLYFIIAYHLGKASAGKTGSKRVYVYAAFCIVLIVFRVALLGYSLNIIYKTDKIDSTEALKAELGHFKYFAEADMGFYEYHIYRKCGFFDKSQGL